MKKGVEYFVVCLMGLWVFMVTVMMVSACTLSFTQVDTHGKSDKVVDEDMKSDADIKATANIKPWETP